MFSIKPPALDPLSTKNTLGLNRQDYQGALSTLCGGCGHDSITRAIIDACFEISIPPHRLGKLSGIGCSSKTPAYFLSAAHGFNSVHGRMPSVATGAYLAEHTMNYLAVSGDGDTGSIGIGQFMHLVRRQVNMLYIVENNGVYGLTKGQFSATSDAGAMNKKKEKNPFQPIDLVKLAIELGAGFVARSFSGDKSQLVPLIQAGLLFRGFALIDVISPCVSFNNHEESTKSYHFLRAHEEEPLHLKDFVPLRSPIEADYPEAGSVRVELHDGSSVVFDKKNQSYDVTSKESVMSYLHSCSTRNTIPTGLLYHQEHVSPFSEVNNVTSTPLREWPLDELAPPSSELDIMNQQLR